MAILAALAVLVIFVYPLTFGPPAPHQKYLLISLLLACALGAMFPFLPNSLSAMHIAGVTLMHASAPSERLALICTRLC